MYKIYLRQAIQMLKQNSFISIISILGTAVAIMMIMAIIVSDEVKSIDIAPEVNRSRTLYINGQAMLDSVAGRTRTSSVTHEIIHDYIPRLEKPVKKAVVSFYQMDQSAVLNVKGSREYINAALRITNADYWDVLQFKFIEGRGYTAEEVFSGARDAVISISTARKLFRETSPMGQHFEINFQPYRVVGVVEDVSPVFNDAYGEVWVPYTSNKEYQSIQYLVMLLAAGEKDFPSIIAEVRECERVYGKEKTPWTLYLKGPENRQVHNMGVWGQSVSEVEKNIGEQNRKRVFIFCMLLLVPAINLSGISFSRIKKRTAEIGVRKAFGAKKYIILVQVLYENFITSLAGGILGLILSYAAVFAMKEWLLGIPAESSIPVGSLVSPLVFLAVFLACIAINLLSAGLPALRASRTTIVNSLNQNDKKS